MEAKVHFELKQEDDWPPVASESIWAHRIAEGLYRLNNVPFFADGVSFGDVVSTNVRDGKAWFGDVVEASSNSTLRIVCFNEQKKRQIDEWFRQNGCMSESGFDGEYISANIPESVDLDALKKRLADLEEVEQFEFEFSSIRRK